MQWSPFVTQPASRFGCTSTVADLWGPVLVPVPKSSGHSEGGRFPWWSDLWHPSGIKDTSPPTQQKLFALFTHFCCIVVQVRARKVCMKHLGYWQKLYDVKENFLFLKKYEKQVCTKQLPGRYWNAASLDLAVLGIWLHNPFFFPSLLHPSEEQQVGWWILGCWMRHPFPSKGCQIVG